jgi:hypothetical protein
MPRGVNEPHSEPAAVGPESDIGAGAGTLLQTSLLSELVISDGLGAPKKRLPHNLSTDIR